ncbi:MAG TPA: septal ring lytic transglycosylase RlpA family protein [Candidatus Peribacteraceae bacterium]|nr:septal ring lytic transglycosylase RlpA family protein [Candidatus Peribacteraceae bacterium]
MFRRLFGAGILIALPLCAFAQEAPITRRDGFLQLWQSVLRPAYEARETPYTDVPEGEHGFLEITYAKRRGLLGDVERFYPDEPLTLGDAALWLFRTRNVADPDQMEPEHLPALLKRYSILSSSADLQQPITVAELTSLTQLFEEKRHTEQTKVSQYGEEFRGEGTAFGETFNPDDFTAAHVTFPVDTLARVTHVEDGRSVLVRVNDRGPFVPGRSMDLSSAAFGAIAEGSRGVITATIERLGDINLVDPSLRAAWEAQGGISSESSASSGSSVSLAGEDSEETEATEDSEVCDEFGRRYQQRIARGVRFIRGVPHSFKLGGSLTLRSRDYFVMRSVQFPDGTVNRLEQWISPEESYSLTPEKLGKYVFRVSEPSGRGRELQMNVLSC